MTFATLCIWTSTALLTWSNPPIHAPWEGSLSSRSKVSKGTFRYFALNRQVKRLAKGGRTLWTQRLPGHIRASAVADNGDLVILDDKRLIRLRPNGTRRWTVSHQNKKTRCGPVLGLAITYTGEIIIPCGYLLLKFSSRGALLWKKVPLGRTWVSDPLVDRKGTIYVTGGGTRTFAAFGAVNASGRTLWHKTFGSNQAPGPVAWNKQGTFFFVVRMAGCALPGPHRCGHPLRQPRLVTVNRKGKLLGRKELRVGFRNWPAALARKPDGTNRLPF